MIYTDPYTGEQRYKQDIFDDYQVGLGENSWYINKSLKECPPNIFQKLQTDMYAIAFVCSCGHEQINPRIKGNYQCPKCDNSSFYDVANFECEDNVLLANVDQEPEFCLDDTKASAKIFVNIPVSIDLVRNKVIFQKNEVYTLSISLSDASEYSDGKNISSDVKEYTHHKLLEYIAQHYLKHKLLDYETYFLDKTYKQLRKGVLFFLKYSGFKHAEFIRWPIDEEMYNNGGVSKTPERFLEYVRAYRTERSIKSALYSRYMMEVQVGRFDALTPFVICRTLKDPNHIVRLLKNEFTFSYQAPFSNTVSTAGYIRFIEFLRNFYTEKQIVRIFESIGSDTWLWEDSQRMINSIFDYERVSQVFIPPRANIRAIHDNLVRAVELAEVNDISVDFLYPNQVRAPCIPWQDYEIVLPKGSEELIVWSKVLSNCLYGYIEDVYNAYSTVYGVYLNNELTYAIEIRYGRLQQFRAKYNAEPDEKAKKAIGKWYKHFFLMSEDSDSIKKENGNG